MKKLLVLILTLVWSISGFAQITENPKIKKKSTKDVFISKIEITEKNTIFHMYYAAKTVKESIKDYFEENPDEAEQLRRMDPYTRSMIIQQMQQQLGGASVSFQPSSYIRTSDGKKYKFVSCKDIPKAPERAEVIPGKKLNFKVYFEKIPTGFELIDLIEYKSDKANNFTYWNFQGIKINNPAKDAPPKKEIFNEEKDEVEEIKEETIITSNREIRVFGKIRDAESKETLSAQVISSINGGLNDSVKTSRSGSYEFFLNSSDKMELEIKAAGYNTMVQGINPKIVKDKDILEKDIFLEKIKDNKAIEEPKTEPKVEIIKEEKEIIPEIGKATKDKGFELDKVYFDLGNDLVKEESYEQLNNLVKYLMENPNLKIQIEGHTDNQGDPDQNKKLSIGRAYNVRQYLVDKGISSKRILFKGYGASKPISTNAKEEDRKKNRRVEYRIIE